MPNSLIKMVEEAEKLQAKIEEACKPLGSRDLLKIWQYITENFWTASRKEEEKKGVYK